jgi:outer membrane protein TolC
VLTVFLFWEPAYSGKDLDTLGLKQAVELGLKNNFQIQLARLEEKQANTNDLLKVGAFLPRVSVQGSGTQTLGDASSFGAVSSERSLGAQISGQWTLFDGFQMFYAYRSIGQGQAITGIQTRREIENQSFDIIRRYLNAVVQERLLRNSDTQKNDSRERLQEVVNAYELGSRTRLEWLQAKLAYQQDSAAWHRQQIQVLEARSDLSLLLGLKPGTKYTLSWDESLPNFKQLHGTLDDWWKEVERKNTDLTLSEQQTQLQYTERSIQRSAFWPKLILRGNYGITRYFTSSSDHSDLKQGQVSLNIEYPLFQGFTQYVSTSRSNTTLQQQKVSHIQLKLRLKHLFYRQWNIVEQALQQTQVEVLGVTLAKERLELATNSYKQGQISGLELREAQLDWQRALVQHLSTLVQARLSILELERMTGKVQL